MSNRDLYTKEVPDIYVYNLRHEVWRLSVWFVWGSSYPRIHEFLRNQHEGDLNQIEYTDKTAFAEVQTITREGIPIPVVILPWKWELTPIKIATLAHECLHASIAIFRIRRIPLPKDIHHSNCDEEGLCYLQDWMIVKFLEVQAEEEKHLWSYNNEIELKNFEL